MQGERRRSGPRTERGPALPALRGAHDVVYGRNPVTEALRGRRAVQRIWAARADDVVGTAAVPVEKASADELARRAGSPDHQGLVAEVDPYPYADPTTMLRDENALVIVLDQVQDPGNLGAICRTAEVAGASGVVIPTRRAAAVTPAVCKASAGAVEHLPIARVANLVSWLTQAKQAGGWIYGAQSTAEDSYVDAELSGRVVLVLGGEATGLRPLVAGACDALVAIPQSGRTESLNVAAAAAVLVFEAVRRQPRD